MLFSDILSRLSGLYYPICGITWDPSSTEIIKAKKVVSFLAKQRALFSPAEMERPTHCIYTIIEIRQFLIKELKTAKREHVFNKRIEHLVAMRDACFKFFYSIGSIENQIAASCALDCDLKDRAFNASLGELRAILGLHVALLAAGHGLEVDDDLSKILPARETRELQYALNQVVRTPICSDTIVSVGYCDEKLTLDFELKYTGEVYRMFGVSAEDYNNFLNAESKDNYFVNYFKAEGYPCRKIHSTDATYS